MPVSYNGAVHISYLVRVRFTHSTVVPRSRIVFRPALLHFLEDGVHRQFRSCGHCEFPLPVRKTRQRYFPSYDQARLAEFQTILQTSETDAGQLTPIVNFQETNPLPSPLHCVLSLAVLTATAVPIWDQGAPSDSDAMGRHTRLEPLAKM